MLPFVGRGRPGRESVSRDVFGAGNMPPGGGRHRAGVERSGRDETEPPMNQSPPVADRLRVAVRVRRAWPLIAGVIALGVYAGCVWGTGHTNARRWSYFDNLADAFLHGRLYLVHPPGTSDLTLHDGRWYVPFPPLAAVLMLPWVALFGLAHTNTVAFSIHWAAINVALVAAILEGLAERRWISLDFRGRCWLVAFFALGSVHWQVALEGSVWYVAHVCTVLLTAFSVYLAVRGRGPVAVSGALAVALWSRPTALFTWPLLLGIAIQLRRDAGSPIDRGWLWGWVARSAVPLVLSVAGLACYNAARFGNPLDFGYETQHVSAAVREDLVRGQFHVRHIPRNLHVLLMGAPRWEEPSWAPHLHIPVPDARGMSIFLTMPALFYVFRARRRRDPLVRGAWLAVGLTLVPLLLYYNTGWRQFGYRFSLDFIIPLLILLAAAVGSRLTRAMRFWIAAGVLINAWGVVWWYTAWLD